MSLTTVCSRGILDILAIVFNLSPLALRQTNRLVWNRQDIASETKESWGNYKKNQHPSTHMENKELYKEFGSFIQLGGGEGGGGGTYLNLQKSVKAFQFSLSLTKVNKRNVMCWQFHTQLSLMANIQRHHNNNKRLALIHMTFWLSVSRLICLFVCPS